MRIIDILFENNDPTDDELEGLKRTIASKIKELPLDDATAKALKEIEELLQHVHAGGRMGMIYDQLEKISDPTVLAAQQMLARYILSMDVTTDQRTEFFKLWKADKIIDKTALFSKEKVSFSKIFNAYDSNPAIKKFVDDIMEVSALGQGRGEFGLNVLSNSIWAPKNGKGDLEINLNGTILKIECKTTFGGAARFSDQQVRPAEGYEQAAINLNNFVKNSEAYPLSLPEYGLNFNKAIEFYQNTNSSEKSKFLSYVKKCVELIFGGKQSMPEIVLKDVNGIMTSLKSGNSKSGLQSWARASFNYYMSKKDDDGVLYINLLRKEFVFYSEAIDLENQGLRLNTTSAPYISTVKDPGRGAYPQMTVVSKSFGAKAAQKTIPKFKKTIQSDDFSKNVYQWAKTLANARGILDANTINEISKFSIKLISNKYPNNLLISELENQFPQLKVQQQNSTSLQSQEPSQTQPSKLDSIH